MYLLCNNCKRIIRPQNLSKHLKKCENTTFCCTECKEELNAQQVEEHVNCPNTIKTIAPPLYNPKAKVNTPQLDSIRIADRMAFEHKDDEKKEVYEKLCEMESIPHKEKGFISYIKDYCHISDEEVKALWDEYSNWNKKLIEEKRNYRYNRKGVNKSLKAEAKKVDRMARYEERRRQYQEKKERESLKEENKDSTVVNTNKYEKQVTKLMRLNLDNYKLKDALKKAVIDLIKEKDEDADEAAISAVFEKKYPTMRQD